MKTLTFLFLALTAMAARAEHWQYQFDSDDGKVYFDTDSVKTKASSISIRVKVRFNQPEEDLAQPDMRTVEKVAEITQVDFDCKKKTMWSKHDRIVTADGKQFAAGIQSASPLPLTSPTMQKEHHYACERLSNEDSGQ